MIEPRLKARRREARRVHGEIALDGFQGKATFDDQVVELSAAFGGAIALIVIPALVDFLTARFTKL